MDPGTDHSNDRALGPAFGGDPRIEKLHSRAPLFLIAMVTGSAAPESSTSSHTFFKVFRSVLILWISQEKRE